MSLLIRLPRIPWKPYTGSSLLRGLDNCSKLVAAWTGYCVPRTSCWYSMTYESASRDACTGARWYCLMRPLISFGSSVRLRISRYHCSSVLHPTLPACPVPLDDWRCGTTSRALAVKADCEATLDVVSAHYKCGISIHTTQPSLGRREDQGKKLDQAMGSTLRFVSAIGTSLSIIPLYRACGRILESPF